MSYIEINAVNGIRNDVDPDRFTAGDLTYARNVDIDNSGKATRRNGTALLSSAPTHSLWSDGQQGFFVENGRMYRFLADGSRHLICPIAGNRVRYVNINGQVYWTDGVTTGVVEFGSNYPWGITPPAPVRASATSGTMEPGGYLVTMTFVDANGKESGAPAATAVSVGGGIALSGLAISNDPRVVRKNIYVSASGGPLPLLAATIDNLTTHTTVTTSVRTVPVRTTFMCPPPPGQVIGYYNGRAYVASGAFLMYSQPFEYDLFDLRSSFIAFDSDIQTFAAVADGIYIGTKTSTVFLHGTDPDKFQSRPVAPHGTVLGTEQTVSGEVFGKSEDPGENPSENAGSFALWMSQRGLVIGQNSGVVKDLTAKRFIPPAATSGAAFLKRQGGSPLCVISLFN